MFQVTKTVHIACAHNLNLPYESKCNNDHGHNFKVTVTIIAPHLNECDMVVDFSLVKQAVMMLDHADLNVLLPTFNEELAKHRPTSELLCKIIGDAVNAAMRSDEEKDTRGNPNALVSRVVVQESEGNEASFSWPIQIQQPEKSNIVTPDSMHPALRGGGRRN